MNIFDVDEVLADYKNNRITENDFNEIKSQNPDFEWRKLLNQEEFIESIAYANFYQKIEQSISKDIDAIERKGAFLKVSVLSVVLLGILGLAIVLRQNKEQEHLEMIDEIHVTKSIGGHDLQLDHTNTDGKAVFLERVAQKECVGIARENDNYAAMVENQSENQSVIEKTKSEKMSLGDEKLDAAEVLAITTQITTQERTEFATEARVEGVDKKINSKQQISETNYVGSTSENQNRDYLINPSLGANLEIDNKENLVLNLSIYAVSGKEIFNQNFEGDIFWNPKNSNALVSNGLYIYQLKNGSEIIQTGQITIVE